MQALGGDGRITRGTILKNVNTSLEEIERHLLATAMSPQLREYISINAAASARVPQAAAKVFVFSGLQDRSLVREMEYLCRTAPGFIAKKCEKTKDITSYTINESLIDAIVQAREESRKDRAECEHRLARRQRFLKSMFLFDIIGSVESTNPVIKMASSPVSFSIEVDDIWDDASTATLALPNEDALPTKFTISARTFVMLRKITQPLSDAKSAHFEFSENGVCNMKLRGVPPAREFLRGAAKLQ